MIQKKTQRKGKLLQFYEKKRILNRYRNKFLTRVQAFRLNVSQCVHLTRCEV